MRLSSITTDFQTLTINEAYVLRKDGSKVETPQNAFNPMLPDNCTSCERLNQIRQMVVTHTALENEATIVLDYSIHSDNFFFRDLFENVQISENVAVERYEIKVSVPDDTPLSWKLNIGEINYEKSQSVANGRRVMEWVFYDVPSSAKEEYLFKTAVPNLAFSSTNNLESPLFAIFRQQAFNEFEQPEIFSFFKNLVSDKSSDMDKILAVRDYIASNISEKSIKPQLINYLLLHRNGCGPQTAHFLLKRICCWRAFSNLWDSLLNWLSMAICYQKSARLYGLH